MTTRSEDWPPLADENINRTDVSEITFSAYLFTKREEWQGCYMSI
jgi:hypothetical protein